MRHGSGAPYASSARRQARYDGRGVPARRQATRGRCPRLSSPMPRYKLTLEYDGTPFVGWQVQENGASVQGRLASAIKAFAGEDSTPRGAGRTDAGVHATGQVAHVDLAKEWDPGTIRDALNALLRPDPIAV